MFSCSCYCHCCCWSRKRKYCIDLLLAICSLFLSLFGKLLHFHFNSFKMHVPFDNVLRRQTTPTNGRAKAGWCTAAHIGYKMVLMRKSTSLNTRPCSILFAHTVADVCVHLILMDLYFIGIQQENSIERNVFFSPLLLLNNNRKHKCGHV